VHLIDGIQRGTERVKPKVSKKKPFLVPVPLLKHLVFPWTKLGTNLGLLDNNPATVAHLSYTPHIFLVLFYTFLSKILLGNV
jgi:hypothetical protein